ncbi:hypothetical protein NDU88_007555 [Pleurodeles waltl]|uniref:Uncharacterized protein n=1 Tax=Pleurodeles waltl TaxID=8319 RepID=A0AAV7U3F5_PLEWA|nr:hypothetical protein NDU88_007555 [Pleurodeles waltl]
MLMCGGCSSTRRSDHCPTCKTGPQGAPEHTFCQPFPETRQGMEISAQPNRNDTTQLPSEDLTQHLPCYRKLVTQPNRIGAQPNRNDTADSPSEDFTQRLPCDRKFDAQPYLIGAEPNRNNTADSQSGKSTQRLPCDRKFVASPYRIDATPVTSSSTLRISPHRPRASKRQ